MKYVLNNVFFCDVILLVGECEEEVSVYKLVFVLWSFVFYVLFEGFLVEKG